MSPRRTDPNHTLESSSISTSPITRAVSAMNTPEPTVGSLSLKDLSMRNDKVKRLSGSSAAAGKFPPDRTVCLIQFLHSEKLGNDDENRSANRDRDECLGELYDHRSR